MSKETGSRSDPFSAFRFSISLIDSSSQQDGTFSECTGLEATMEVHEYKEGGVNDRVHKFPTRAEFSNITLKKGMRLTDELWKWHYEFVQGIGKRKDGKITLKSENGEPVKVWYFKRGLPLKWTGPDLNATQNALALEALEISHEGLKLL
ncbi:MAG: phage tail protein [Thermodesulfobacteriota bacterium]